MGSILGIYFLFSIFVLTKQWEFGQGILIQLYGSVFIYGIFIIHDKFLLVSLENLINIHKNKNNSEKLDICNHNFENTHEWHKWVNVPTFIILSTLAGYSFIGHIPINIKICIIQSDIFIGGALTFQLLFSILGFLIIWRVSSNWLNVYEKTK